MDNYINLFSILNDTENKVDLVFDMKILSNQFEFIEFKTMSCTSTSILKMEELQKFLKFSNHEV